MPQTVSLNVGLLDTDTLTTKSREGFTNPQFGSFKAGVVESSSAETGYDNASGDGNTANFEKKNNYKGSAQLGNPSPIRFYLAATAGQEQMFVIRQEVL
ncbi:hypothetical protein VTN00DRAFT_7737 [Thermoascus crustaceus]|uniref:uncharacterized protein n=1 Tax=Thermoascus crustaceus TaxID=5088 RepID=UPI003744263A